MAFSGEYEQRFNPVISTQSESERNSRRWSAGKLLEGALVGAGLGVALAVTALGIYIFFNGNTESGHLAKLALLGTGAGSGAVIGGVRVFRDTITKPRYFWPEIFKIPRR